MNWRGYAEMSRAVLEGLFAFYPELNPGAAPLPGVEELGRLLAMPNESVLVQIARYNSWNAWGAAKNGVSVPAAAPSQEHEGQ